MSAMADSEQRTADSEQHRPEQSMTDIANIAAAWLAQTGPG